MADTTIPQLQEAAAEDVNGEFLLPVDSGAETYKLKFENLMAYLVANFPSDWITEAMVKSNAITSAKIASGAVTTAKIGDNQVTTAKIANGGNNTVLRMSGSTMGWGSLVNAHIANNAAINTTKLGVTVQTGGVSFVAGGANLQFNRFNYVMLGNGLCWFDLWIDALGGGGSSGAAIQVQLPFSVSGTHVLIGNMVSSSNNRYPCYVTIPNNNRMTFELFYAAGDVRQITGTTLASTNGEIYVQALVRV